MKYRGGTDPIRALGMQAKVRQVTNTYAIPRGTQTELHSPHSISEQGLEMRDAFHGNNLEMGKQWNWDYTISLQAHQNSTPAGHMRAFSEMLPLRSNPFSGYPGTFLIQTLQGRRPLSSVQRNLLKIALHFIFRILNMLHMFPNSVAPKNLKKKNNIPPKRSWS